MKSFFSLFFLLFVVSSCVGTDEPWFPPPPINRDYDSDAFTNVTLHQAARLAHQHRWYLEDGWMMYDDFGAVHGIRLQYRTQNLLTLEKARAMLVDFVEEFLTLLQANPDTAINLAPGFNACNLLIYVDFQSYWGLYGDPFYIGWMVLQDGRVYYYNFDVKNINVDYWYSRIETYEKSKEVVRLERLAEEDYQMSLPPPRQSHLSELIKR